MKAESKQSTWKLIQEKDLDDILEVASKEFAAFAIHKEVRSLVLPDCTSLTLRKKMILG